MSVHLYVRSSFSLLDSTIRINDLVHKAKQYGYRSLALTDHNVMHGAPVFLRACAKEGIHPVFGLEADCMYHDEIVPFLLLAKDNIGFSNLMKLSSAIASGAGHCTAEQLIESCRHCFLIVFSEGGWFDSAMISENREEVTRRLTIMKEELPPFDVALSYMDAALWKARNSMVKRICSALSIRTCALNLIYYLDEEDSESYRIMRGIGQGRTIKDQSLPLITGRSFLPQQAMEALYESDDLARTDEIADQCRADMELEKTGLPVFDTPQGVSSAQYLTQLCIAGLKKRMNGNVPEQYIKRLKYELDVIVEMHFEDYFLIVYDFIRYARKQSIYVGPGRGSAAGSLVSYTLGITQIDPLKYGLLFERFLNPERISMPDIDTDFPDDRRQEVIDYVYRKYGSEHIANIVTFGTLGAKQVIRDVGRVLDIDKRDIDMLARMIPNTQKITLSEALRQNARLAQVVNAERRYQKLFRIAQKLEGLPRHTSLHAAGIVMSRLPLQQVVPVMQVEEGMATVQYTMEHLESRGLIKMDFLGLRNLTIIDDIVRRIQKEDPGFRIMDIPMDDPAAYEVFRTCDTTGIFQFESSGMKNLLRKMKPDCFEDIVAALALYRPGPMDNIPVYLNNRQDPANIKYPDSKLEPVLKSTYGVMIYQEQVMMTARIAAGFTLGKADVLRKAVAKKNMTEMENLKQDFLTGCRKNGYPDAVSESLFAWIEKFAGYGFNRSHAVAYGVVAYQLAYLKAQYPLYFYCALIDSVIGDDTKCAQYIDECRRRRISVSGPDVSLSEANCTEVKGKLVLPLTVVKSIGEHVADEILAERAQKPFDDYFDCVVRLSCLKISRKMFEMLIDAGAFDCFGENRSTMKGSLDEALSYADLVRIEKGGMSLIDMSLVSKPVMIRMADDEAVRSECEKQALGFYIGTHPIALMRRKYDLNTDSIAALKVSGGEVTGFAMIQKVHQHRTKKGDMMAFLNVMDETGNIDLTVMPNLYRQYGQDLVKGNYILFHGRIEKEDSCLCGKLKVLKAERRR